MARTVLSAAGGTSGVKLTLLAPPQPFQVITYAKNTNKLGWLRLGWLRVRFRVRVRVRVRVRFR